MKKQQGITLVGMLLTVVAVIIAAIIVLRVVPVYIENYAVRNSITALQNLDKTAFTADPMLNANFFKKKLVIQLDINGITDIKPEQIKITSSVPGTYKIEVEYQVKKHFVYNIDLLFNFHEIQEVKVGSN